MDKFKREMEDDITTIFARLNDRLGDIEARIKTLQNRYKNVNDDTAAIRLEIVDIQRDVDTLSQEIRNIAQIQQDVILDLGDQVRTNGLYIGTRWRLSGSGTNGAFFISDITGGGYYRFGSTGNTRDVETLVLT